MFRHTLLALAVVPLAAFAQDEEPEIEPVPDRKYECHDRYSDDSTPYILVETFSVDLEDIADEIPDDVSDEDLAEAFEALTKIRASTVTISETVFDGMAYQDGLDYRVDFSHDFASDDSDDTTEYSLVIRADGDAAFYDFSDVEPGEKITPDRLLSCKKTN